MVDLTSTKIEVLTSNPPPPPKLTAKELIALHQLLIKYYNHLRLKEPLAAEIVMKVNSWVRLHPQ